VQALQLICPRNSHCCVNRVDRLHFGAERPQRKNWSVLRDCITIVRLIVSMVAYSEMPICRLVQRNKLPDFFGSSYLALIINKAAPAKRKAPAARKLVQYFLTVIGKPLATAASYPRAHQQQGRLPSA
jgi:hypothetical protein